MTLDDRQYVSTANEPEMLVIDLLDRQHIRGALAELPAPQRNAIDLAYYAGFTCAEIAARTSVLVGTVKTRLRLGILKLRSLLFTDPRTP